MFTTLYIIAVTMLEDVYDSMQSMTQTIMKFTRPKLQTLLVILQAYFKLCSMVLSPVSFLTTPYVVLSTLCSTVMPDISESTGYSILGALHSSFYYELVVACAPLEDHVDLVQATQWPHIFQYIPYGITYSKFIINISHLVKICKSSFIKKLEI